jgi:mRNA interferase RelE/StbE
VRKLRDVQPPRYRLRVGDWRVLYTIDDQAREVRIYRIKHREKAY